MKPSTIFALFVFVIVLAALIGSARGHDQYTDWKMPDNPSVSCCNQRVEHADGHVTGDCRPVTASPIGNGAWKVTVDGHDVIVPPEKVMKMPSPDGRSHWCGVGVVTYCFVPGEVRI